jgi:hypothetical protein
MMHFRSSSRHRERELSPFAHNNSRPKGTLLLVFAVKKDDYIHFGSPEAIHALAPQDARAALLDRVRRAELNSGF